MGTLLAKTRMINELLQQENTLSLDSELPYNKMADALGDILDSNTYIINKDGKVLGYIVLHDINNERIKDMLVMQRFPKNYAENVGRVSRTEENIPITNELTAFPIELREELTDTYTTVVPIYGAGERLGTIILGRIGTAFDNDDLVLAEYSATVVGMQILHQTSREIEQEIRNKTMVQMAINTLSYSELKAVKAIFDKLEGDEGRLTASNIADQIGITRSVIVNALRKLESAGIIESRSLGMKGTYIKIINHLFKEQLAKEKII
ncbi:GTP-sensing pleiotropic transcriptional regulator CodY [Vagococcus acidifermentans]|uniref:Global transcriptional regulator CodY n=1 Tax=Vagococcus acidifermentans TaxID=564710 RepID=A0A430AY19_9ENTE|nr:GTP-sensing pleiotropic transcriptional regulator CodY [Vagococcus acidifermentans]RSU12957.1 GTP-sensing pleiotropic transcriptional regulator CodY [Vagococcus acidifermentans]